MGSRSPAAIILRRKMGYAVLPFAYNGLFVEFSPKTELLLFLEVVRVNALDGVVCDDTPRSKSRISLDSMAPSISTTLLSTLETYSLASCENVDVVRNTPFRARS